MTTAKWTINIGEEQDFRYPAARFNEKGCLPVWGRDAFNSVLCGGYFVKTVGSFLGFEKILEQDVILVLEFLKNQRFFDFQIFKRNWRLL
jgi:hypothetical protein